MSRGPESATHKEVDMETVHRCCAGLDVHKKTIAACVRRSDKQGRLHEDIPTFGTMTGDLLALADWMSAQGVTHVAMESTGVFWKPVFNILEGNFELLLVNARHIKQVPGRKTDVKDCQWIAQLLRLPVDRPVAAAWSAASKLRSAAPPAGAARSHAAPCPTGRRAHAGGQPHPQDP
jgi:hypothetical protein